MPGCLVLVMYVVVLASLCPRCLRAWVLADGIVFGCLASLFQEGGTNTQEDQMHKGMGLLVDLDWLLWQSIPKPCFMVVWGRRWRWDVFMSMASYIILSIL